MKNLREFNTAPVISAIIGVALPLLCIGLVSGSTYFVDSGNILAFPALRYPAALSALLMLWAVLRKESLISIPGVLTAYIFCFFLDFPYENWSYVNGLRTRVDMLLLFVAFLIFIKQRYDLVLATLSVLAPIFLVFGFLSAAEGKLIFSDDHPSFIYRLSLLKDNFPFVPFYNPQWNFGFDSRDFFATGSMGLFLLWSPLIYLTSSIESIYNYIVPITAFVLSSASVYFATREFGYSKNAARIASVLILSVSFKYYEWVLLYGAMGFVLSTSLMPINISLAYSMLFKDEEFSRTKVLSFVATTTLMLFWSASGLVFIPLILLALLFIKKLYKRRDIRLFISLILAINIPWILLFLSVSKVGHFISLEKNKPKIETAAGVASGKENLEKIVTREKSVRYVGNHYSPMMGGKAKLREFGTGVNPIFVVASLVALLALTCKKQKVFFFFLFAWLGGIGTVGAILKPQLELERMLIIASQLLSIPIAVFLAKSFEEREGKKKFEIQRSLILVVLVVGILCAGAFVQKKRNVQFSVKDEVVDSLINNLKEADTKGGRIVFAGFVLHELKGGHIAPLERWVGKPIVASTPFHNAWWYTELVPKNFLEKKELGIERYFDLVNATIVVEHEPSWLKYMSNHHELYEKIGEVGKFRIYRRLKAKNTYIIEGSAEVLETKYNHIKVKTLSSNVILSYQYFDYLELKNSGSCKLEEKDVEGLHLVSLKECKEGEEVIIRGKTGFRRMVK